MPHTPPRHPMASVRYTNRPPKGPSMKNRLIHPTVAKAGGIGVPLTVLVLALFSRFGVNLTSVESGALASLVTYGAAFLPSR